MSVKACTKLAKGTKLYLVRTERQIGTTCSHYLVQHATLFDHVEPISLTRHKMLIQVYGANGPKCWDVWSARTQCRCAEVLFDPYDCF